MEEKKTNIFCFLKILLGLLLITSGVVYHPLMYVAILYCFLLFITEQEESQMVCMLIAWVSVSTLFKLSIGATSFFTYLEIVAVIKLLLIRKTVDKLFLCSWLIFILYAFIGIGTEYTDYIKSIMMPILFLLMAQGLEYLDFRKVSFSYIFGMIYGSVIGLLKDYIPNMNLFINYKLVNVEKTVSGFVTENRFSALWEDPNYYSIHVVLVIAIVAVMFFRSEIKPWIFYPIFVAMTVFGAMTGSKSFLLVFVLETSIILVAFLRRGNYVQFSVLSTILLTGLVLILVGKVDLFNRILVRLSWVREGTGDFTTGRVDTWKDYILLFWNNLKLLFFGNGLGKGYPIGIPHNTLIDYISIYGIIGSGLFYFTIFSATNAAWGTTIRGSVVPFGVFGIMCFSLSMFYGIDFPFELLIALGFLMLAPPAEMKDYSEEGINNELIETIA